MIPTDRRRPPRAAAIRTPRRSAPPALESGDVMTRDEFERRYGLRPDLKKAELVEGVVYVASPTRNPHGTATALVVGWLAYYHASHPDTAVSADGTVRLADDTEVQPDAFLRLTAEAGGQAPIDADAFVAGAPELVIEVAHSSASRDLHAKKRAYQAAGVREYVVWELEAGVIHWFALVDGAYVPREPDADGVLESTVFDGLRLDVGAMLGGDLARVLDGLAAGAGGPVAGVPPA